MIITIVLTVIISTLFVLAVAFMYDAFGPGLKMPIFRQKPKSKKFKTNKIVRLDKYKSQVNAQWDEVNKL